MASLRFKCEHCGRRLVVKNSLAGRQANCPHCHQRLVIPNLKAADTMPLHMTMPETGTSSRAEGNESVPTSVRKTPPGSQRAKPKPVQADFTLDKPVPLKILGAGHPIHDHRNKVWCVRKLDRQEIGPIPAIKMWEMIQRVELEPEALVWREDWDDWFSAGAVFPELNPDESAGGSNGCKASSRNRCEQLIWKNLPAIVGAIIALGIIVFLTVVILIVVNS